MKEQDAQVDYDKHQLLLYVEKSDGHYGALQTGSFLTKNYVDDFWEKQTKLTQTYVDKLCKGEISPVGFYMVMINISAADLAKRIGISASKVRKHQDPIHFEKISVKLLAKYADVFGIPVANMFQVIPPSNGTISIHQKKTSSPLVVTSVIVEEKK